MVKLKFLFLITFLAFSNFTYSQEICNNGIDDDSDGLIDLNDVTDCVCTSTTTLVSSLIPNASFETTACCPNSFSQLNCASGWIQATEATSDYFNTCGYIFPALTAAGLVPFPNGNGIVGAFFTENYKEYVGSCLQSPMIAGTNYQLMMSIASTPITGLGELGNGGVITYGSVDVTIYGATDCTNLPAAGNNCLNSPWAVLGTANYTPSSTWGTITFNFTPSVDISAVIIGSPCNLPLSYPAIIDIDLSYPYFYFDNLILNTTESFNSTVTQTGSICENNLQLSGVATAGANYQWYLNGVAILGQTGLTLNVSTGGFPPGNYSIVSTVGNTCSVASTSVVTSAPLSNAGIDITVCSGISGNIGSTPISGYSYAWSPTTGLNSSTVSNPTVTLSNATNTIISSTYSVTTTDIFTGCTSTDSVIVNVNPNIIPTFAPVAPICNGDSLSALPTTSLNGFIGTWSPALDNTTTTTYTFTPDTGQCATTTTLTVTVNPNITPTFADVTPICSGDSLSALPTTSINGYTGIWSPSINNTQTTTYTFSSTSGACINSATMTILVSAIPPGNQPGPLYYCDPNNDGFGVFDLTEVIPIVIGQNDMDVSFHETVTDAENDLTFIPNPSNYYNINVDNQTIYIRVESTDQSVFVTGTGSYVGGVFSSFPPGLQINPVDGTISPTNSTPGSYTVTYTTPASPNCPSTTSTTVVTITELPSASISYNDLPFCTSSNFQPVNLVGSGGVFSSTSGISIDTITGVVNPSESIPGTYIVTYTIPASGGCEEVKTSTQVTINDSPKAQISYSNPSFCVSVNGTQLPLLTGSDSSTASYLGGVYLAGVGLSIDSVTGAINPSTSIPGLYTVTYSTNIDPANPNCPLVIATTQVTINPLPTASISYPSPFCSTDISKNVNLVGSGGTFSSTTGLTIDAVNGTISPSLSNPGTYTVSYIIPASNGCNAVTATTIVTITPAPSSSISYSNSPFCKSISTPQIPSVTGSSGGVFSSSAGLSIVSSSGAITPASSTIGNYSVLYTLAASGGCPAYTTSTVVAVNSIISPIVNCGVSDNNSVSFIWDAIQGVDNYSVSYQINSGTNINVGQIGNLQSYSVISLNPLDVVTITVTPIAIDPNNTCYTSSSGTCTATNCVPSTATINYPNSPFCSTSTMMEPVTISGNSSGTFSSTTGLTIDANTGAINPSTSSIGQYTVSYTIPSGPNCPPYITTATLVINGGPIATISYLNPIFCKSLSTIQPVTLTGSTGGTFSSTAGLAIDPITGEIQPNGSVVGNYTVSYTIPAIGGCQAVVVSTQVEIIDSPMASISYPSPICSNDTTPKLVTLTGTSGGIFTSSAGLTIDSITGTITPNTSVPGTYTITYTIPAANGCDEVIANADVVITQLPSAGLYYNAPFCSNDNTIHDATILPGLGIFSGGSFSSTPSGLSMNSLGSITPIMSNPGTYTVTYTIPASAGCPSVPVSTNVKITPLPSATISYSNILCSCITFCQTITTNQFVTLNLSSSTVIAGLFTAVPDGLSINSIDGSIIPSASLPGTYTVTYTIPSYDGCGEVSTSTTLVIQELSTLQPNVISNDTSMDLTWNALPGATGYTLSYTVNNGPNIIVELTGNILNYSITGINIGDLVNFDITPIGNVPCYVPPGSGSGSIYYPPSYYLNCATAQISYNPMCISQTLVPVSILGTNTYLAGTYSAPLGVSIDSVTGAINPSLSTPGTFTVTYTIDSTIINNCICPLVIATTQVTINPLPTATISYASPFCSTDISKVVNLVGSGGTFSSTTGLTIDAVNGTISPSLSNPGTYTVSYIIPASNGCNAVTATTIVTITPAPSSSISYSNSPFCKSINTPQIPSVTGSPGGVFSSSAGLSIVSSSGAITPGSSTIGNYSVLYTIAASGGCPAYTTSTAVVVNSIIAPIVNCGVSDNNSVSFIWDAIQGVDNYSVSYQINSGTNINVGQIGNLQSYSVISLNPLDVVTITVTPIAIDPNNTCYTSSSITCTATNCLPSSATISYPSSPFCSSSSLESVTISGNNSGTFSSSPGLTIDINSGAINPSASAPGTYTISYTIFPAGANCPAFITTATVVINNSPTVSISYSSSQFCKSISTSQPVNLIGSGGTFASTVGLVIDSITGEILPNGSAVGTYTITYTILPSGGCQAVIASTQVEIIDSPMASISYPSPICSNETTPKLVTFTGTSGGEFSSTGGLAIDPITGTITPNTSAPGTYTITYTIPAANGCDEVIANVDVVITDTLSSPIITCGTSTLNSVTFLWDPVTGADNYSISYQVGSLINNIGSIGSDLNYTISNLNPGDLVTITVTPSNSLNNNSCIESTSFTCSSLNCSINEIQITPTVITTNSVQFNWNPIQNATAYWLIYQVNGNINTIGMINSTNYTISNLNPGDIINITISASIDGVNYFCQSQGNAVIPSCNPTSSSISYSSTFYCKSSPIICHKILPLELIVNPTPEAEPADYHVCDDNYDGFATFDLTSTTTEVLGTINPVTNSINYYTSIADAQTNSNPINNLTNFINTTVNTQTLWIRAETIATGCFDIVTLQLVVDPLPNATQPNYPPYTLCDNDQTNLGFEIFDLGSKINDILLGQNGMSVNFYFSQADALSDSNALPLLYVNSAIYVQTLWIRIENVFTGCFVLSTMDIRVEPLPSPILPTSPYTICDDNQDGFSSFDLNTLTSDILQGANYTITYHETLTDAQLGSNSLVSPYDNLNPFIQSIYASALDNVNGCRSVIPIELNVEPKPKMPTNIPPIVQCDEDNNSQDLTMLFDLTQITPIILAVQDIAASNYTVTYYISEADAIAGLAPIIQSTAYTGTNNQIIWVRVENNASQCFAIGSFMLSINPPLLSATPLPLNICDNDAIPNNQFTVFDLTVRNNSITQGQPNMTVTYYPSYPVTASSIAIPNPTSYTNVVPAVQTLGVMLTNAQGCRSYTSLDIRVLPIPTPRTNGINPLTAQCDDNLPGDMLEAFDLTANAAFIINGDLTLTLHYYPTQADALADTNEILNPTAALVGNNVWIRVENNRVDYQGNNCYVLVEQPLTVNPLPIIVQPLAPYRACDDNTDGIAVFDLTNAQLAIAILGATQLPADYTISYYLTAAGANPLTNTGETPLPNNYTNVTPNAQTIYIRVVNNTTGCVNTGILPLAVEPYATATGPQTFNQCDSYADLYDGVELIDLTTYAPAILNGQDPTIFLVSYYTSFADAQAGTNALTLAEAQAYQTDADTDTIWVKVENSSNLITPFCNAITTIAITIEPLPEPIISSPTNNICVDYATNVLLSGLTLNSGLTPPNNYTFVWSLDGTVIPGATASIYEITTVAPGDYTVVATSTSSLACVSNVSNTFTVIQSGPAQLSDPAYTVSNPFENNQVIVVNVVGFGQYEFSLDDGPFQNNNVFENVSLGSHTITIRDVEGNISCEEIVIDDIQIINYPHYFTPNGDGIHDTWNVVGLENEPRAKLYIFDRYGKLLKQLSTTGKGWDGTYNGYLLPSTDYWFKIEFPNLKSEWKEFKSHFSLKR